MEVKGCKGQAKGDQLVFSTADTNCQLSPVATGTHLVYKSAVKWEEGDSNAVITRIIEKQVDFECLLEKQYTLTLENGFKPLLTDVIVDAGEKAGKFELAFGLWKDNTFATPLPSNAIINVPENLFVATVLTDPGSFVTTIKSCWATPR